MPVQYRCPECEKVLRAANAVAPGKKIKCPACANVFVPQPLGAAAAGNTGDGAVQARKPRPAPTSDDDDAAPPSRARGKPEEISERRRPSRPIDDEDDDSPRRERKRFPDEDRDEDDDKPRRRKKKKSKGSSAPLIIGLASLGALLVILGITGFVWPGFFLSGSNPVAKAGNPGPAPMPGPGPMAGPDPMPMPGGGVWEELDSKEHGFKVMMPGKAISKNVFAGGVNQQVHILEQGGGAFCVSHIRNPGVIVGNDRAILQKIVDGFNIAGRVTSNSFVTVQGRNAVELTVQMNNPPGAQLRSLVITADNRILQVFAVGTPDFVRSPDVQKFISSFQLTR